jgi:hypothetical protein
MKLFIFVTIAFLLISATGKTQGSKLDSCKCSETMDQIAHYWKLDSLANNGYRLQVYHKLLACKLENITRSMLLDKLGKPNETRKTNHGTEYWYYYFDSKAIPNATPTIVKFLLFRFGEYDKYANSVDDTFGDY